MLNLQSQAIELHIEWEQDDELLLLGSDSTVRPTEQLRQVAEHLKRAIKTAKVLPLQHTKPITSIGHSSRMALQW